MSTAELTAHRIYDSYRFASLPDDVKRSLAVLFITSSTDIPKEEAIDTYANVLSFEEKEARLTQAVADAKEGRTYSCEEVYQNIDKKFPWLCE